MWITALKLPFAQKSWDQVFILRILIALILASIIAVFFILSYQYVGGDEGSYIYETKLILSGHVPFKDFVSRAPAQIILLTAFMGVFGATVTSLKVFNTLLFTLTIWLVYSLVRRTQPVHIAGLAALITATNPLFFLSKLVFNTTSVSIVLILYACYLIRKRTLKMDILTGIVTACAVLTRETNAFFLIGLILYLFQIKEGVRARTILLSSAAVGLFFIIAWSFSLGIVQSFSVLTGIGRIGIQEAQTAYSHSIRRFGIFLPYGLLPLLFLFFSWKRDGRRYKETYPEILWVVIVGLFYAWYSLRRGFLFSYGAEFIPLCVVIIFSVCVVEKKTYSPRAYWAGIVVFIAMSITPYTVITPPQSYQTLPRDPFSLDKFIGSGIPFSNYKNIEEFIQSTSVAGDTIMTGNLVFALDNNLSLFMNITRPLIYEGTSEIYKVYNAPLPETIISNFKEGPPTMVIIDQHLAGSLWPLIGTHVASRFHVAYRDEFATILLRNNVLPMIASEKR